MKNDLLCQHRSFIILLLLNVKIIDCKHFSEQYTTNISLILQLKQLVNQISIKLTLLEVLNLNVIVQVFYAYL